MKKQNKGITLIALVITIIVLLILAGVAIVTLTGENGILTQAGKAKTQTTEGEEEEQVKLGYAEYLIAKESGETEELKVEGATVEVIDGKWKIKFNKTGKEYYFDGKTLSKATTGPWKQEGDKITNTQTNQTIKVGDYVNYDPTLGSNASDLTYSSPASKTGADSDQDFDAKTYKEAGYGWRVLGVANGKIRLISEEFVGAGRYEDSNRTYYTLAGQNGYINGIDELNKISAIFGHGKGAESATSITVDDINSITGYNPETAKYGEGEFYEYGNKVTYTRGEGSALSSSATNGETWSGTQSTFNYYDKATKTFKALTSGSTTITSTYYHYNPLTLGSDKVVAGTNEDGTVNTVYKMLFGYNKVGDDNYFREFTNGKCAQNYWLASDSTLPSDGSANWGLHYVGYDYVSLNHFGKLYGSGGREFNNSYGVRPIVSLKSDISLEWNETAQEWKIQ